MGEGGTTGQRGASAGGGAGAFDLRRWLRGVMSRLGFEQDWYLILVGAAIGSLTALLAVGFAKALHGLEHEVFETQKGLSVWLMPLLPMAGGLVTGLLTYFFARDATGHGVPNVMKALIKNGGRIPLKVGAIKALASIATVASGGSAGPEGPIVQIGSTGGSWFGRVLKINRDQMGTLVGCGAAAGMASIFNAPIAGVLFVMEVLLRDFSLKTFTPILVASVFSSAVTQAVLGQNEAIFQVSDVHQYTFSLVEIPSYILLGVVCGVVSVALGQALHAGDSFFEKVFDRGVAGKRVHPIMRPVIGALGVGVLGVLWVLVAQGGGEGGAGSVPAFFADGYRTIEWLISQEAYTASAGATGDGLAAVEGAIPLGILLLVALVGVKILATVLTLSTGGSGGAFAPSLFVGAVAGAAFGLTLERLHLMPEGGSPAAFAVVGMAAVIAGTTHAPLTAILMLFELTRDVYILLPIMLAAVIATVVAQLVDRDSIYTATLRREGLNVGRSQDLTILRKITVASCDFMPIPKESIYPSDPLSKVIEMQGRHSVTDFVIVDQESGRYMGLVTGQDIRSALLDREAIPLLLVAELMRTDLPTVSRDDTLDTVLARFSRHDVSSLCVVSPIDPTLAMSMITRSSVLQRYQRALEES
ncbi:MAG: chloride channel protein [Phycisphaerales bacterium]